MAKKKKQSRGSVQQDIPVNTIANWAPPGGQRVATLAYLPPNVGFSDSFAENLASFKMGFDLITYSDASRFNPTLTIERPETAVKGRNVPLSINNFVFLKALDIAVANRLDYFIYLEEDCRVGCDYWDSIMLKDFFNHPCPLLGGTLSIWNMGWCGAKAADAAIRFAFKTLEITGRPPLMWQAADGSKAPQGMWIYPNGALGVYHVPTTASIFNGYNIDMGTYASNLWAWDVHVGRGMWNQFKEKAFEHFSPIASQYSGYKEYGYRLPQRKKMLERGEVVAIHQIKEAWQPNKQ